MKYTIDKEIFVHYPDFVRAVIVAEDIDNKEEKQGLITLLETCEKQVQEKLGDDFKSHPRLASWADIFKSMNINPNRYPPSVVNLVKRVRGGKPLPYVNSLVAAFNCISLLHLCPCGGDDLDVVVGNILLTFAKGDEHYVPLGQPDISETPPVGEVIYMDTGTKEVFCRAWCWKNGDTSKIMPNTKRAAINIDCIPPMNKDDIKTIAQEFNNILMQYTHAKTTIHYLDIDTTEFEI